MINFEKVEKNFKGVRVLNDLTFDIEKGQTCALLGLSGSGKTTALKIICGLHTPDSGQVLVSGIEVTKNSVSKIRSSIGYVIQDGGLFPHLTARSNLELAVAEIGWSAEKTNNRIDELTALTQLNPDLLTKYPRDLSGGQRQRVGLMRALLKDPDILLLDEPLGALDPITRGDLQRELKELCLKLKKTVVLVTHDLFEAGFLANKIVLLQNGSVAQQGSLRDLIENPTNDFVRTFVEAQQRIELQ